VLCLHANVVTTPPSLERFIASADGPLVALRALPVALVDAGTLPDVWAQIADPEADALDRVRPAQFTSLPQGFFAWVRQAEQAAEVERRLLLDLPNPRDGRVDTRLNRHLSRPLTRFLLRSPLTPNQVTVLSLISSLFAAWAFARGRYGDSLLGALLFQFAAVLDCCDGEIARVKYLQSRFGDLLDIVCDAAGNLAVFVGIAYGAWVSGHLDDVRLVSWSLVVGITITFVLVTWGERRPAPATDTARRLIAALSTRDFSVLIFAAALTSTLPWFIRGAAIGVHVFWITLAILLRRSSAAPATRSSTPPGP
jgi:phosphatidylglycerophosphate synthase